MHSFKTTLLLVLAVILGLGSGCSKERKKNNHLAKAESYLQKEQYQRAEIELRNAARIPPESAKVWAGFAEVYVGQGRWGEAYYCFRKAAGLEPANPNYRFQMAALELDLNPVFRPARSNAFHAAQAILQRSPTNGEALLVLSKSIYSTNSLNTALQLLEAVPAGAKESAVYHTARGNVLIHRGGKASEVLPELQAALKQDTNYAAAYEVLAGLESRVGNRRGALLRLKQASEAAPHRTHTRLLFPEHVLAAAKTSNSFTNLLPAVRSLLESTTTQAPDFVPGWVRLAELNRFERKYSEAAANLQKVTAIQPMNREALLLRAEIYADQNNFTNAVAQLQKLAKALPNDPQPQLEMARLQLRANQLANAEASVKSVLRLQTNNAEALMLLARLNLRNANYAQAIAPLRTVLTNRPGDLEPRFLMAYAYAKQGQGEKAMEQWILIQTNVQAQFARASENASSLAQRGFTNEAARTLAELGNSTLQIYRSLATNQIQSGFTNAATQTFLQISALAPTNTALQVQTASALAAMGNYAESRRLLERISSSTNAIIAQSALAELDVRERKWDSAKQRVKKQLEQANLGGLWAQLGSIYAAHGQEVFRSSPEVKRYLASPTTVAMPSITNNATAMAELREAEAALKKALELEPDMARARNTLASLYQGTGRAEETIQMMDAFLSETNTAAVQQQKGILLEQQGEFAEAAAAYKEALELNPNLYPSLNNLAALYAERLPNLEEALPLAEKAYKLAPRSPQVQDTLGWILLKRGDYSRARDLLEEANRAYRDNPEVMYHLGIAHYMMGSEQAALQHLTSALKIAENPNQRLAAKAEAERALAILRMDPHTAGPEARSLLQKSLADNPRDTLALLRLAALDERAGSADAALKGYEQALAQNPNNWQALYGTARLYASHRSDTRKALELATRARTLNPREPSLAHFLGTLAYKTGDYKSANTLLNEAATANSLSTNPQVQFDFGLAAYAVGKLDTARDAMMRAAQAQSFDKAADAKAFVATATAATNAAQAVQYLPEAKKILTADPQHLPALMVVAVAQEAEPAPKEAARSYSAILAKYPQFAPASRNLAVLSLVSLSDPQSALTHAIKAREEYPQDPVLVAVTELARHRLKQRPDLNALERVSRAGLPEPIKQEISRVLEQSRQSAKKS